MQVRVIIKKEDIMLGKMNVMILPVGIRCNLACTYCYENEKREESMECREYSKVMEISVLDKIFSDARLISKKVDFIWHGGEPLLAGINFFSQAISVQKKYFPDNNVRNILQTNGTLLSEEKIVFFLKNNFILSTSIDGSKKHHDANRIHFNGKGTYDVIKENIKILREKNRKIGAVVLISKENVFCPNELYYALKQTGLTTCALHLCLSAGNFERDVSLVPSQEEKINFMKRLFEIWMDDDDPSFMIRNFRNIIRSKFGGFPLDCCSNFNHCRHFIAIDEFGDVYPCHRFVKDGTFLLGNVMASTLRDIYFRRRYIYDEMSNVSSLCKRCPAFKSCGGGCAYERYAHAKGFNNVHPDCAVNKSLYRYVMKILKEMN